MNAKLSAVLAWARQTSTILGLATLAGLAASVIGKQITWAEAAPAAVGALVALSIPGHPDVQTAATQAAKDAVTAIQAKGLGGSTMALGADLTTLAGLLPDNTPVVAVQHTVTLIHPSAVPGLMTTIPAAPVVPAPATSVAA